MEFRAVLRLRIARSITKWMSRDIIELRSFWEGQTACIGPAKQSIYCCSDESSTVRFRDHIDACLLFKVANVRRCPCNGVQCMRISFHVNNKISDSTPVYGRDGR